MNPVLAQKVNSGPGRRPYRTAGAGQTPKVFTLILKARLRCGVPKAPAFVPVWNTPSGQVVFQKPRGNVPLGTSTGGGRTHGNGERRGGPSPTCG